MKSHTESKSIDMQADTLMQTHTQMPTSTHTRPSCVANVRLLPWWLRWQSVCLQCRRPGFDHWVGKIPWRRKWHPTPVHLPGKSHERRSLVGYSPRCHKELDTTEGLHFHFQASVRGKLLGSRCRSWSLGSSPSFNFDCGSHM